MPKSIENLCLGTVQLGMKYGINNGIGRKPTSTEALNILSAAYEKGINTFDTASGYGNAEELIGCSGLIQKGARIISKLSPTCPDNPYSVIAEIKKSLEALQADHISCYMLHRASGLRKAGIMGGMVLAKESGLIENIGVSVYEPDDALSAANDDRIDFIQIPYNALDYRMDDVGFFNSAAKYNKTVFARSAFLQGLMLMTPEDADNKVLGSGKYINKFQEIAASFGYSPAEAAFLFSVYHPGIQYTVFGVDTLDQLLDNIRVVEKVPDFDKCFAELLGAFSGIPREIVNPSLWNI